MSVELIKARKRLSEVNSLLKQGKPMAAANALTQALATILRNPLMKNERDEFAKLIDQAVYSLNQDKQLRQLYPLVIPYKPGQEKELYKAMQDLLAELQNHVTETVQNELASQEEHKKTELAKGQVQLDQKAFDQARDTFGKLVRTHKTDTELKADIADRYLKASQYDDALSMLEHALETDPQAVYLYNRIAIVLRKLKQFDTSEQYFLKALEHTHDDEYLYFNLGRLYFDWKKWDRMRDAAGKALEINPDFKEAEKMRAYAMKKI
ncbi:Tetratricopeptide repeat-containing protein [Paucidesulfovibrio gracilis DSM 16080]|uniref:Tetratricopeptide repeat-containing protein n=1 Tax=Paucidesulfovibrio gracilis DSM 16080 TaxID=1121449 RepID=A0A1T4WBC7_9BACT|nr:tetratricopeptide repeat protein [Paucidesulfovibrio gracilis]SKA74592.1 Tetratricopeptide repeat-containing protein [Paucidesulfovibrio gracilis DSM 16080]